MGANKPKKRIHQSQHVVYIMLNHKKFAMLFAVAVVVIICGELESDSVHNYAPLDIIIISDECFVLFIL